ncbi:MFS transporter [Cellulomonas flavigena]|uniref:MFS transporter n=1 Tax=Cellulomonas flavigena TaxID=1711 RepID=UPI00030232B1|nr:MFS transporter [Cellulomonas flavigena]
MAVGATYAAQGFGYATIVTALPGLKARTGIEDDTIALVLLLGALLAAGGSVTAERLARRWGSRTVVVLGLLAQAVGLACVAVSTSVPTLVASFVVFAVGLGMVDASCNMQGVALQHRVGRAILSTLFACLTVAAIVAALTQSGLANLGTVTGAVTALVVAVVVATGVALTVRPSLVHGGAAGEAASQATPADAPAAVHDAGTHDAGTHDHPVHTDGIVPGARTGVVPPDHLDVPARRPLPRVGIWLFGALVAVAFVVDSAVSSWSTVYLHDELRASASVAPLGYAAYQGAVLVARLAGDPLVQRHGRVRVALPAAVLALVGLLVVALVPSPITAVAGFALAGVGAGALVPLAFSAAGELAPERLDDVVARINLFNYAGAILGAVALGLLSEAIGLGPAFLVPALLLVPAIAIVPRMGAPRALRADV